MARFPVAWGNPPATHPPDQDWHGPWLCVACGARLPKRAAVQCGECAHAWRWAWLLRLHVLRRDLRFGPSLPGPWGGRAPWWRLDCWAALLRRALFRRIWVCPCCAHDL